VDELRFELKLGVVILSGCGYKGDIRIVGLGVVERGKPVQGIVPGRAFRQDVT
jgi:hypothetical protein